MLVPVVTDAKVSIISCYNEIKYHTIHSMQALYIGELRTQNLSSFYRSVQSIFAKLVIDLSLAVPLSTWATCCNLNQQPFLAANSGPRYNQLQHSIHQNFERTLA